MEGKMTIIAAGFPGVGKSEYKKREDAKGDKRVFDADSSAWSWKIDDKTGQVERDPATGKKIRHPDFPHNYVKHLSRLVEGDADVVLTSTHKEVLDALVKEGLDVTLVYPEDGLISEYDDRYKGRNTPEALRKLINENWSAFLSDLKGRTDCDHVVLKSGQFLGEVIDLMAPGRSADDEKRA
jgi:hypothetical protein